MNKGIPAWPLLLLLIGLMIWAIVVASSGVE